MRAVAPISTTDRARSQARCPVHSPARRRPGFSVLEGLVASAVLAIAVVGVAGPLAASSQHASVARERGGALALARQLMEQIAAHPLVNGAPTPLGPQLPYEDSPAKYDTVGDFHGYQDYPAASQATPGARADATYARSVSVEYRTASFDPSPTASDFALVTVTVTTPRKETLRVSRLFCKHKAVR
jgi:type II secretory pathway pseudopilin PulG